MNNYYSKEQIQYYLEEIEEVVNSNRKNFACLDNCNIMVTGATGSIGQELVDTIITYVKETNSKICLVLVGRNQEELKNLFKWGEPYCKIEYVKTNYKDGLNSTIIPDYIFHLASITSSKTFIDSPVDTIVTNISITSFILSYAEKISARKFIYLSSQEVYGVPDTNQRAFEEFEIGKMYTNDIRNSYPESKRVNELLCLAYAKQYGLNTIIARLGKTYGMVFPKADNRVFIQFARCVKNGEDIILKSDGKQEFSYVYASDAVNGLIFLLGNAEKNEIYNICNDSENISISKVAEIYANLGDIKVLYQITDTNQTGYAKVCHMNMSARKMRELGWNAKVSLKDGAKKIYEFLKRGNE